MDYEVICAWLGIPPGEWPPDHYRLLGLPPGTDDVALIEQRVHDRLDAVRRYQMMHPEQATEAMNRLAQAFVCLTDPASKRVYDSALLGERPAGAPPPEPEPLLESRDPLAWLYANPAPGTVPAGQPPEQAPPGGPHPAAPAEPPAIDWVAATPPPPPPVRRPPALPPPLPPPLTVPPPVPPDLPAGPAPAGPVAEEGPSPPPPPPPPEPVDPILEAAQSSPQARRGLGSKRALYHRVSLTRELLRLWGQLGKYLADPERKLSRAESAELARLVAQVEDGLHDFPPLLGEAGQPGYMVVALNQLDSPRTIQNLSVSQRESLNRDWKAGLKFLAAHRDFLRAELRLVRRRTLGNRLRRRARAYLSEQPGAALLALLALVALGVALWRSYYG